MLDLVEGRRLLDATKEHEPWPDTGIAFVDYNAWLAEHGEALLTFSERAQAHQLDYVRATPCASCGTHVTLCCTCGADFEDNTSAFNQHVQPDHEVRQ